MVKYGKPNSIRPKNFFPRLDAITVYAMTVERITGKARTLPPLSEQWPAIDQTTTPQRGRRPPSRVVAAGIAARLERAARLRGASGVRRQPSPSAFAIAPFHCGRGRRSPSLL
jgi:hypothetical protein